MSKNDLSKLIRDKSFSLVLLSQLIVISLSITAFNAFPTVFYGYKMPSRVLNVALVGNDVFYESMTSSLNIDIYRYGTMDLAFYFFERGQHRAIIYSDNYNPNDTEPIIVYVYSLSDIRSSMIISRIKQALEQEENKIRGDRIKENSIEIMLLDLPETRSNEIPSSIIYSLLLPLFFLSTVVLSGNLFINFVTMEMEKGTLDILLSTPVSKADYLYSKSISCVILIPFQLIIWMLAFTLGGFPLNNMLLLILLSILYGVTFTSLAIPSIYIGKNRDNAQNILTIFLVLVFIFLLPLPESFIANLGFTVNIIPAYLITQIAYGSLSTELIVGLLFTIVGSILIFWSAHRFGSRYL